MGLPQLKEHHTIWTPELVEIDLPLAGLARRCIARIIDQLILGIGYVSIFIIAGLLIAQSTVFASLKIPGLDKDVILVVGMILVFVLDFTYYWAFHTFNNGQTPGKMAMGIRVVTSRGGKINAVTSVIRGLLNYADVTLGMGGISAFMILATDQEKRIADFGAGTLVIRNHQA